MDGTQTRCPRCQGWHDALDGDCPRCGPLDRFDPQPRAVEAWQAMVATLRDQLRPSSFALWIEPLRPAMIRGTTLVLAAPGDRRGWIERRWQGFLELALPDGLDRVAVLSAEDVAKRLADTPSETPLQQLRRGRKS